MSRRTTAAAALLAAAVAAAPVSTPPPAHAVTRTQPAADPAVAVTVRDVDAVLAGRPDDRLRLRATVTNISPAAIPRLRWRLRVGPPVTTRAALGAAGAEPSHDLWPADVDLNCIRDCVNDFAAGSSHDLDLAIPAGELTLPPADRPAVYPLRLELTSRLFTTVGSADTFLVSFPSTQRTLRIGWLVPVTDPPRRDAFGRHMRDELARSVALGGRLDRVLSTVERAELLAGNRGRPALTLAVDAEVVEAIADMADGYQRAGADPAAEVREVAADEAAAQWITRLRQLADRHTVVALPHSDVDAVALVRAGLGTDLVAAIDAGRRSLATILGTPPVETIAWPIGGFVDSATLGVLASNGTDAAVLDETALPVVAERTYTTTAAAALETPGRTLTALVADSRLAKLAAARPVAGAWPMLRQRLLAETAVVQQQRPSVRRDLVVPLPRIWAATDVEAVAQLIAATARAPWMTTATLPSMVTDEARADNRASVPQYPAAARAAERPAATLQTINRQRAGLLAFRTLLAPTDNAEHLARADEIKAQLDGAQAGLTRAQSAHWRGRESTPRRLVAQVRDGIESLQRGIQVVFRKVTLTSRSGPVPITIVNQLRTPVEVRVRLHSPRAGLTFGQPPDAFVVQPGQETIDVRFEAVTVGSFPVTVQLLNAENRPVGEPTTANVRTTAFGPLALIVTGVAFVLLVLAAGVRVLLRRRRRGGGTAEDVPQPQPQPLEPVGGSPDHT